MKRGMIKKLSAVVLAGVMAVAFTPVIGYVSDGQIGVIEAKADASTMGVTVDVTYGQTEARGMLDYINKFRAGNDVDGQKADYLNEDDTTRTDLTGQLSPLTYDYDLEKVAMQRAAEVAVSFSHTRPDGTLCFTAWDDYGTWYAYGENIAAGSHSNTAYAAFLLWREDDEDYSGQGHRRNMLGGDFTRIGIGHVVFNGIHYWTQAFGKGTGNDTATSAKDAAAEVSVNIKQSQIQNLSVTASQDSYEMNPGDTAPLPEVSLSFRLPETWPEKNFIAGTDAAWSSADSSVAGIQDGKLKAVKAGETSIRTKVNGKSIAVPVKVIDGQKPQQGTGEIPMLERTSLSKATVSGIRNVTYTGKAMTQNPVVKIGTATLKNQADYTLTYKKNKTAGTATVIIIGKGNYKDSISTTFKISKAANPLKIKVAGKTYKRSKLKKAVSFTIGASRGQGKVTYTLNAAAKKAKIKVTGKGKATVPKKCRKGTYKITVRAAGNKNYKAGSKTVTIKVKS